MKVVFKKTGEVKEVADGYARNFLLPRGVAVPATPGAIQKSEELRASQSAAEQSTNAEFKQLADALHALGTVTVKAQANDKHKLFAALHQSDISQMVLEEHSLTVSAEYISLEPIKQLGSHSISISLPGQSDFKLDLVVISK